MLADLGMIVIILENEPNIIFVWEFKFNKSYENILCYLLIKIKLVRIR